MSEREAHVAACIERETAHSTTTADSASVASDLPAPNDPPVYANPANNGDSKAGFPEDKKVAYQPPVGPPPGKKDGKKDDPYPSSSKLSKERSSLAPSGQSTAQINDSRRPSLFQRFTSKLGADSKSPIEKQELTKAKADELMTQRWGPPGSPHYEMAMRYWIATRMQQHWEYLRAQHPRRFKRALQNGYMEPIPTAWVRDRRLAYPYPEFSTYENAAEERLYYLLNEGIMPDGSKHAPMRPLNIQRDMYTIIRRGNERNARQVQIAPRIIQQYRSPGDVFLSDRQIHSHDYSAQVTNVVYDARRQALHELADGIIHGTDHLETMILLDISSSMTWNPHAGMVGPDGIRRVHDQPANIRLTEHLVHRVLNHMIPRAQTEHPHQVGIDTVTFSSYGSYIGQLSARNFRNDWDQKVRARLGGGTQVMQGWQVVKNTYFQHQNKTRGHGRFDPVFGWQPTPGMPKLSLLVFLDGEATDMDEFELELLGETWAYVTIALVGMEGCPHHHSHAIELERVARFNPHVGFFDVHGRVLERLVVQDILGSVYPVDPPAYEEILKPEYDLKAEELPGYSA